MNAESDDVDRKARMERIQEEYLQANEPDRPALRSRILREHPDLAQEFLSFLDDDSMLKLWGQQAHRPGEPSARSRSAGTAPRQVGPYKLLQKLGEGGMGTVYMAEQEHPIRRRVAIKIIKRGMDSGQVIARFEAERQALALMDHPNIAKVLDAGTTETGRPYFVMELVKGVPITRYCDEQRLTPEQRLRLFMPVCHAIHHAHQKGIIHRDVKPSNVLVAVYDDREMPKVIDFGVAKATGERLTERTLFTELGAVIGTLEYMSPEQSKFNALDIDIRTDIYSLGVLLYELLTGATPFDRQRLRQAALDEICRIIRDEEPPKPSARLSASGKALPQIAAQRQTEPVKLTRLVRGELDWIVMKSLEKQRSRRYESASEFARDVQRYLDGRPVEAGAPSAHYRLWKFARKHRTRLIVGSTLLLAFVAGIVAIGTWAAMRQVAGARDRAQRALVGEIEARRQADASRMTEGVLRATAEKHREQAADRAVKLDVAYAKEQMDRGDRAKGLVWFADALKMSNGSVDQEQLNRRRLAGNLGVYPRLARIWFHQGSVTAAQFSPDGSRVVTADEGGNVSVWELGSDQPLFAVKHSKRVNHAAFSPSGRSIVSASDDQTVRIWDAVTGHPLSGPLMHQSAVAYAAFSPNSRLVVTASDDKSARIWDVETGQPLTALLKHTGERKAGAMPADYGYDTARDISRVVTALSTVPSSMAGMKIAFGQRDGGESAMNVAKGLGIGFGGAETVHLMGTFAINNFGEPDALAPAISSWSLDPAGQTNRLTTSAISSGPVDLPPAPARPEQKSRPLPFAEFSPNQARVVTACEDGTARLWDVKSGQAVSEPLQMPGPITQASFSPDGSRIVVADQGLVGAPVDPRYGQSNEVGRTAGYFKVWNSKKLEDSFESSDHGDEITRFSFSARGLLVTASRDGTARIWNISRGILGLGTIKHGLAVNDAAFSPDGRYVATASEDRTVWVVNVDSGKPVIPPLAHGDSLVRVSFSSSGRWLLTASVDGTARLWDLSSSLVVNHPVREAWRSRATSVSGDGRRLVLLNDDDTVRVCDTATGQSVITDVQSSEQITQVSMSPDGRRFTTAGKNGVLQLRDADHGRLIARIDAVIAKFYPSVFSPDGRFVIATGRDGRVGLCNAEDGKAIHSFGRVDQNCEIAISSVGRIRIATADANGRIAVWDLSERQKVPTSFAGIASPRCLALSPDGRHLLASGLPDEKSREPITLVWEVDREMPPRLLESNGTCTRTEISSDGRRIVAVGATGVSWLWDKDRGKVIPRLLKHGRPTIQAGFSPDGRCVVTASVDGSARVWDARNGDPVTPYLWHPVALKSARFTADGKQVVTIDEASTARIWDLAAQGLPTEQEDVNRIAEVFAGNHIDMESGDLEPLNQNQLRERWQAFQLSSSRKQPAALLPDSQWHWRQAEDAAQEQSWSAVLWHLDHLTSESTAEFWARHGDANRGLHEFDKALDDYERALRQSPTIESLPWEVAGVWRERGDYALKKASPESAKELVFGRLKLNDSISLGDVVPRFGPTIRMARDVIGSIAVPVVVRTLPVAPKDATEASDFYVKCQTRLDALPPSHPRTLVARQALRLSRLKLILARLGLVPKLPPRNRWGGLGGGL